MKIFRLIIAFALICFALSQTTEAVNPPPDGGYPNLNTAEGQNALFNLGTGSGNTAVGAYSLFSNMTGTFNTAVGAAALAFNTAEDNTAIGAATLLLNTGNANTAIGSEALLNNTIGYGNVAVGVQALYNNHGGTYNNAFGGRALWSNQGGESNNAFGYHALYFNVNGVNNTAMGDSALYQSTGNYNTAIGYLAGQLLATGTGNVYIGPDMWGVSNESNHTYIRNINTTEVSGGSTDYVTVDLTTGLLGHLTSSRRYKEEIKPMEKSSEALYRLKPVSYHYKKEIDPGQSPAFGLIAEDVAEVNPNLVARNSQGQPESVHYEMVNAMLLNEFLREHTAFVEEQRKVEKLEATIAQQHKDFEAAVAELKGQIQRVSAQLELSKPAPKTVLNNQ
jgi:hypothetical protein